MTVNCFSNLTWIERIWSVSEVSKRVTSELQSISVRPTGSCFTSVPLIICWVPTILCDFTGVSCSCFMVVPLIYCWEPIWWTLVGVCGSCLIGCRIDCWVPTVFWDFTGVSGSCLMGLEVRSLGRPAVPFSIASKFSRVKNKHKLLCVGHSYIWYIYILDHIKACQIT